MPKEHCVSYTSKREIEDFARRSLPGSIASLSIECQSRGVSLSYKVRVIPQYHGNARSVLIAMNYTFREVSNAGLTIWNDKINSEILSGLTLPRASPPFHLDSYQIIEKVPKRLGQLWAVKMVKWCMGVLPPQPFTCYHTTRNSATIEMFLYFVF